jgi:hypothetical protein
MPADKVDSSKIVLYTVRFQIFELVVVKVTAIWDLTPRNLEIIYQRFGGTCCLNIYGTLFPEFFKFYPPLAPHF